MDVYRYIPSSPFTHIFCEFTALTCRGYFLQANILHATVRDLPILPDLAARLEEEIIRRSIFGTAAIEGNPLKEEEVARIVSEPDKRESLERADKEIRNLKIAHDYLAKIKASTESVFILTEDQIKHIHSMITRDIAYEQNVPGNYRNHIVKVGDDSHGGVYTPPHILEDIQRLMNEFRNMSMKMRHFSQTFSVSLHHLPMTAY